jgi:hypothetical protein
VKLLLQIRNTIFSHWFLTLVLAAVLLVVYNEHKNSLAAVGVFDHLFYGLGVGGVCMILAWSFVSLIIGFVIACSIQVGTVRFYLARKPFALRLLWAVPVQVICYTLAYAWHGDPVHPFTYADAAGNRWTWNGIFSHSITLATPEIIVVDGVGYTKTPEPVAPLSGVAPPAAEPIVPVEPH